MSIRRVESSVEVEVLLNIDDVVGLQPRGNQRRVDFGVPRR